MRNQDLVVKEDEDKDERAQFEALYQEQYHLGEGGCGSVFAGYRKSDNLQVAIKHIPKDSTCYKEMEKNKLQLPTEVFIMLKLHNVKASGSVGSSAPIGLVDWFDLNQELILILERPVPSKDLLMYVWDNGASPEEDEAKIILKQLIDAAIHLENTNIFHRDIKMENILLETGSGVPRLRLIDFGLSCVVTESSCYQVFYGTPQHIPPEWYSTNTYTAGPTTVWQIGVVLFDMLHRPTRFDTTRFLDNKLTVSRSLSEDCKDLLQKCFTENPEQRPTLKELRSDGAPRCNNPAHRALQSGLGAGGRGEEEEEEEAGGFQDSPLMLVFAPSSQHSVRPSILHSERDSAALLSASSINTHDAVCPWRGDACSCWPGCGLRAACFRCDCPCAPPVRVLWSRGGLMALRQAGQEAPLPAGSDRPSR
ncbi:serine/threonine-protein kinase pim-1-like [Amphiprion ocellaris]|uniref:serine/threonine-protein kinase pim-1-like n=1 Tax=Amphiprion ocellaris TaxID=80972 RepID=UPI0024115A27|nr:serine/threonine-protein kinase pim-1-like [Amphiprion ocellaris]